MFGARLDVHFSDRISRRELMLTIFAVSAKLNGHLLWSYVPVFSHHHAEDMQLLYERKVERRRERKEKGGKGGNRVTDLKMVSGVFDGLANTNLLLLLGVNTVR